MLRKNRFFLYLIRHGESAVNVQPDLIGQDPETPLTVKGEGQALKLRQHFNRTRLRFDQSYSSDYTRARETARIVCEQNYQPPVIVVPELREYSAGDWRHGSRKEILTPEIKAKMASLDNTFQPPHGEALNQVERRASKWLEDTIIYNEKVIDDMEQQNGVPRLVPWDAPTFALYTHGMTIKCLLHYVMGFDKSMTWKIDIENTSVTTLSFNLTGEVGWRIHGVNDISHLK